MTASHVGITQHSKSLDFRWNTLVKSKVDGGEGVANCTLGEAEE